MEGAQMESLQNLTAQKESNDTEEPWKQPKSEFQELGELFSPRELQNVHAYGGNLFQPIEERINPTNSRLFIPGSPDREPEKRLSEAPLPKPSAGPSGSLTGVYQHVCSFKLRRLIVLLTGIVSACSTIPISSRSFYFPLPADSWYASVLVLVKDWRYR